MSKVTELLKVASQLDPVGRAELVSSLPEDLDPSPHSVSDAGAISIPQDPNDGNAAPVTKWSFDMRPVDTTHAISVMRKYLQIMEAQIPLVQKAEMSALEDSWPEGNDEEELSIHSSIITYTENLFEEDLIPTMRYSSIVFLHTVFETRLRDFCNTLRRERDLPISLLDLKGSAIDQARDYLTKMVDLQVGRYPEWNQLRAFQDIRNCIVHEYGFVRPKEERFRGILKVIESDADLSLNDYNRIVPESAYCVHQLANVESFLLRLMSEMGWKTN